MHETLCYTFCPIFIDKAERKRKLLMDGNSQAGTVGDLRQSHTAGVTLADNRSDQEMAKRNSVFSMGMSVTKMLSVTSDRKLIDIMTLDSRLLLSSTISMV